MIRKITMLLAIAGIFVFCMSGTVMAVDTLSPVCSTHPDAEVCQGGGSETVASNSIYGPNGVLTKAANLIAVIVGMASVVMIVISGFKFVTASGDPGNIKSARDTLLYAIVGIVVTVSARFIVLFVLSRL